MERDGIFPISIKVGGKRLYVEAEVKNWIEARIAERAAV
jgi:predicted DNA-binding transcriptional regulator AlpA